MLEYFGYYNTPTAQDDQVEDDAPVARTSARRRHTKPVEPASRAWDITSARRM